MKANEHNIITLLKKQKEEGILYVIETYGGLLQSIVRRRLAACPDKAEECMNDIFLGIWQNIDSFDPSKGTFINWACGVARLETIDTLRRMQRQKNALPLEEIELPQEDEGLLHLIDRELSEETEELLSCLSEKDRQLFLRIYMDEEDPVSVGQSLGISRDNVYVRLFRGKKKIHKKYTGKHRLTQKGDFI